jgi:methionine synthase II (cobalamin-independent)
LRDVRAAFECNALYAADLSRVEDEAILKAVRTEEDVGIQAATDGAFRRKERYRYRLDLEIRIGSSRHLE